MLNENNLPEIDITFVVPVYNTGIYLNKCIDSIINQGTNHSIEVIIINDGSTDNSLEIIKKYDKNTNVKIISQSNKGLSATRNTGIKYANGKYIWFVDSDDYIEDESINKLTNVIRDDYDIIAFNTYKVSNWNKSVINRNLTPNKKYTKLSFFLKGYIYPYSGVQFYLFNRMFIINNNLRFMENTIHEDLLFTPLAFAKSSGIFYTNFTFYNYIVREGSIVNSKMTYTRCFNYITIINKLLDESFKFRYASIESLILRTAFSMGIGQLMKNFLSKVSLEERIKLMKSIKSFKYIWIHIILSCKPYYILRYIKLVKNSYQK